MLDLDKLYFNSDRYRTLLENIGSEIRQEDIAKRSGDSIAASKHGLKIWDYLLKLMKMAEAQSIYELDVGGATIYDMLYWASNFVDNLHNASIRDKSFEKHIISICEAYVDMHHGMLAKDVRNLGNIRTSLAECYFKLGKSEKTDDLFREWLSVDPDWGFGWIGWSDLYWLWNFDIEKDFKKAENILKEGLNVPNINDREHIKERLADLKKAKKSNTRPTE